MSRFIKAITNKAVIVMLVISIILLVVSVSDTMVSLKDAISFEDILDDTKLEDGDHVKGELLYSFGSYAAEDTVTEKNGVVTNTEKNTTVYYVIPGCEDDLYYGLAVNKDLVKDVDRNTDETYEFMEGKDYPTTCPVLEGRVKVMDGELLEFWVDWLEAAGYTSSEIDEMGDFYYIDVLDSTSSRIMTVIGLILIIVAVIVIILIMSKEKRKEEMAAHVTMTNQQGDMFGADPYAAQNMNADPYAAQNMNADPYAAQNMNADPYAAQNTYADPYAAQNMNANPYAAQNTYVDPYATQNNQSNNNMQ